MKINIVTLFPKMVETFLDTAIIRKAKEKGFLEINIYDLRDYADNSYRSVDDYPYGGGPGMVIEPTPIFNFFKSLYKNEASNNFVVSPSPQGRLLSHNLAKELSQKEEITLLCGHYEGIDERAIDRFVDCEISIGDFVLSGGELPSLVILDSILRLVDGVISKNSADEDSFGDGLLDSPCYTRPREIDDLKVPEELLNGNHKEIALWRREERLTRTLIRRPDLLKNCSEEDKNILKERVSALLDILT